MKARQYFNVVNILFKYLPLCNSYLFNLCITFFKNYAPVKIIAEVKLKNLFIHKFIKKHSINLSLNTSIQKYFNKTHK